MGQGCVHGQADRFWDEQGHTLTCRHTPRHSCLRLLPSVLQASPMASQVPAALHPLVAMARFVSERLPAAIGVLLSLGLGQEMQRERAMGR